MASGSSVGDGYRSHDHFDPPHGTGRAEGQAHRRAGHASPRRTWRRKLFQPDFEAVVTPFDQITDAVKERAVDAGLIIHEAQLTFDREGFHRIVDLGRWFKTSFGLPLPLGANVLLRSLDPEIRASAAG